MKSLLAFVSAAVLATTASSAFAQAADMIPPEMAPRSVGKDGMVCGKVEKARYDAFTVMIVLNVEERVVGIVVDSVSDVIPLSAEQIRPTPEFGAAVDTRFISGIGTQDERMLILLDIETLLDSADMGQASLVEDAAA